MKSYIACIQKLNDIVNETTMTNGDKFLACPSLRMFEAEDFKFLSGENLTQKDFLKSEDLSLQLNSLSLVENYWDIDPNNNLFDRYKSKINQIKSKHRSAIKQSLNDDIKLLYNLDESETELLEKYNMRLNEYDELLLKYEEIAGDYQEDMTEDQKIVIDQKLNVISKQVALQLARWELNSIKSIVETALEKINHLNDYDLFLNKLKEIKSVLLNSEFTGLQSNNSYDKLQIIPFDFYENDNAWSSIEIDNEEFDGLFKKAKQTLKGFNESILEFDYEEDFIEKISLNYCIVNIKRKWLVSSILDNDYIDKRGVSTPATYAKRVILVKDLRVILKDDLSDNEKTEIEKNSIIKFGPIFMKNQFFKNKGTKKAFIKPITRKSLIKKRVFKKADIKIASVSPGMMMNPKIRAAMITKAKRPTRGKTPKRRNIANAKPLKAGDKRRVIIKNSRIKPIKLNAKMNLIHKINWDKTKINKVSNIHFDIKDTHSNEEIYKADISIQNKNTNLFKEIETDEQGVIKTTLPKGSYDVSIRKNGYKEINFIQSVQENKNVNIIRTMEPQEVVYDSYFLMGIIGESINL